MKLSLFRIAPSLTASVMLLMATPAVAASTQSVRDDSFQDFQQGEMEGTGLSSDGFLFPAYERESIGDTGAQIVWSVVEEEGGSVLAATGHHGQLVRVRPDGEREVVATVDDPELTAAIGLGDGRVLVAGAPSGNLYLLDDDELTTHGHVDAKFVWDMERSDDGTVWIATGTKGKLFRFDASEGGEAELAAELASTNLLDLWIDREGLMGDRGLIYLGSQDPGWLYRYRSGDEEAEVIFSTTGGEIRALQPMEEGLAIAVNTERAPSPQALNLTLRMNQGTQPQGEVMPTQPGGGEGQAQEQEQDLGDVFAAAEEQAQAQFSAAAVITPEGYARMLFNSPERPIHSLALSEEGNLLAAAGNKGRIFEVTGTQEYAVVADLQEDFVVAMHPSGEDWLLAGARNGVVYTFDDAPAEESIYRSRVIDAGAPADWGNFYWRGTQGGNSAVHVSFRTGSSDDPEKGNWEEWSEEQSVRNEQGIEIAGGPDRYFQYRLRFEPGNGGNGLRTDYVEAFYKLQNQAPIIQKVTVSDGGSAGGGGQAGGQQNGGSNGEGNGSTKTVQSAGSSETVQAHSNTGIITVSWSAADPNQDTLIYSLLFKGEEETVWKLIEEEMTTTEMPLSVRGVADGRYRFKVVASDAQSNPPGRVHTAEAISDEVIVDNTPPQIEDLRVSESDGRARVQLTARDDLSLIASIEADIDNGDTFPMWSEDEMLDETREEVDWTSPELEPGEHVITIAVTDRRGNTTVSKEIFTISE